MKIVQRFELPEMFEEFIFKYARSPLYSSLNISYSAEYENTASFKDLSFGVQFKGELLAVFTVFLKLDMNGREYLDGCGRPALFTIKPDLGEQESKTIKSFVRDYLSNIQMNQPGAVIRYYETTTENGGLSIPGLFLLESGGIINYELYAEIDLLNPLPKLSSDIRKSYKSLINWGVRNLKLRILTTDTILKEDIDRFRELHIQVAGKETRSKKTWDLMYEMVIANEAFMIDGFWDDKYVTASFFICNRDYCYYGVSASDRSLFDKPLLHASIWKAIEHAKNRDNTHFEMGLQVFNGFAEVSKKEIDISTFKRGFGGNIKTKAIIEK